jgi:hypothetical protein
MDSEATLKFMGRSVYFIGLTEIGGTQYLTFGYCESREVFDISSFCNYWPETGEPKHLHPLELPGLDTTIYFNDNKVVLHLGKTSYQLWEGMIYNHSC